APPNLVEIINQAPNSKLELKEGEDVTLECQARNAKPAARIVWYRGNVEIRGERVSGEEVKEVESPNGNPKLTRFTTISRQGLEGEVDLAEEGTHRKEKYPPSVRPLLR
ncbi:hypothetical protein RR48_02474, partial [Papilio machaon]